ncbi:constitutive coactivator of PPAR-gamma-like protein 1 homolog isoform X2 [Aphidius gifuensis]|uniref:constitutive coactivator of PPAR-gamma-like protein 1 homolog isoform X2 n=1 Tax=Aphidius gifuensis TaxID=684658 RepID=UPI001CDC6012|nr:constitutive coactivator of PPAR-gamma-like protein 1 homolog isoform X2 [Aphidius gifuensis]XP_044007487.1 constitutive coactivator of PPAR-gamma-like protein 1 homolog isoform X2 [Aphidius gifuensis]
MGIQDLQTFLDSNCAPSGVVPVDLLKIAKQRQRNRSNKNHQQPLGLLRLVLDGECCLDRLYGGYFSDWASGGQWNRMVQFLAVLIQQTEMYGVKLIVFLNGCNETQRRTEWIKSQLDMRVKVNNVLKHIATKGTPPPKIWWIPPICLHTSLRMSLRHLKTTVVLSMNDHHLEVIKYCRDNNYNGLIADDAEYIAFDPPRYFSSEQLKLTYKGSLETKEYLIPEVIKSLGIQADRLCILTALLGNFILSEQELNDFYKKLSINSTGPNKTNIDQSIKIIAGFVKDLLSSNIDFVSEKVFGTTTDSRCSKLEQSIQYYISGTKEASRQKTSKQISQNHIKQNVKPSLSLSLSSSSSSSSSSVTISSKSITEISAIQHDNSDNIETSKFASETLESEQESLNAYNEATANSKVAPQIVIEPPVVQLNKNTGNDDDVKIKEPASNGHATINGVTNNLSINSSSASSSIITAVSHNNTTATKHSCEKPISIPTTVAEVMRTAIERHQKGLMSPDIYQILETGEIKLPMLLEDENNREFPSIHLIYRPIRQMVYAILFNLNHKIFLATNGKEKNCNEKIKVPDVIIKEWIWSKNNPYQTPEEVKAEKIGWGVPTIQRLWFGSSIDDKRRRLRGFLTCMRSDTPLILNVSHVPQHLLIMACVLRYIMTYSDKKILRRQELDAFIAQAFSPNLMNAQYLQDLQLPLVTFRGVQLATLFMAGVETALLANDACGAPIPWLMCCPWLYFDGKLFHHTLARSTIAKNLLELCGGHIDRVVKVERMRKAILEGLSVVFARPPIVPTVPGLRVPTLPSNILPVGCVVNDTIARGRTNPRNNNNNLFRELIRRPVPSRGGRLEVAGVVVGQWGANYGQPTKPHATIQGPSRGRIPPQPQFPRINARLFQPRANNNINSSAVRGKKTQMKATSKKKGIKKNQENDNKKDIKLRDNSVEEIVNADEFSKLLKKDINTKEIISATVADKSGVDQTIEKDKLVATDAISTVDAATNAASQSVKDN